MDMEKTLIVYYSHSGASQTLAAALQKKLGCDLDRLEYAGKARKGLGLLLEALGRPTKDITGDTHPPGAYSRVLFVSPVWGGGLATPIRSYMKKHQGKIKAYGLLVTCASGGLSGAAKDAAKVMGVGPAPSQQFLAKDVGRGEMDLKNFKG
jgi:hypothetical protein